MNTVNFYNTALYMRLSKDDTDIDGSNKTESNSISNQRRLLYAYVQSHKELRIFDAYIDSGYSGTNFERPEFQRMIEDVQAGRVNCVLVKDLSRFGRDYIEAGRFIQKTFPAFSVRFIAVTDQYDSLYADKTESSLILPIKNFVNDNYCRDISIKVRAQQRIKRMEGKCISAFAVYGYQKDPKDRNKLIVDEYVADIIRKIFAWKIAGMSLGRIAKKLNLMGILSPMEYKKSLGIKYYTGFCGKETAKWAATSVKRILENRTYTGMLVQGKQEKVNYKIKKRMNKPKEEWVCVGNTHKAIISEWEFDIVQELLQYDGRTSEETDICSLFSGILFCADCKVPMIKRVNNYKGKKKVFFICQTKNKSLGCSRHSIEEEELKQIVFKEIKKFLELMVFYSEIIKDLNETDIHDNQVVEYHSQIAALHLKYDKYYKRKNGLLADLKEGLIDEKEFEEFQYLYQRKCDELDYAIVAQKKMIKDMFQNGILAKLQLERIKDTLEPQEFSRELLVFMVQRIYIYEDKRLEIEFRFSNELEKLKLLNQKEKKKSFGLKEGF